MNFPVSTMPTEFSSKFFENVLSRTEAVTNINHSGLEGADMTPCSWFECSIKDDKFPSGSVIFIIFELCVTKNSCHLHAILNVYKLTLAGKNGSLNFTKLLFHTGIHPVIFS